MEYGINWQDMAGQKGLRIWKRERKKQKTKQTGGNPKDLAFAALDDYIFLLASI